MRVMVAEPRFVFGSCGARPDDEGSAKEKGGLLGRNPVAMPRMSSCRLE